MLNAVCTSVKKGRDPQIVIWDVPRSVEDHISWQAIESVKNGFFYSGKYEGGQCMFDNPHVVIFANIPPPKGHLSEDRIVQHAIEGAVPDIDSDVEDEAIAALADLYGRGGGHGTIVMSKIFQVKYFRLYSECIELKYSGKKPLYPPYATQKVSGQHPERPCPRRWN